jgi:hypothetical protein
MQHCVLVSESPEVLEVDTHALTQVVTSQETAPSTVSTAALPSSTATETLVASESSAVEENQVKSVHADVHWRSLQVIEMNPIATSASFGGRLFLSPSCPPDHSASCSSEN